MHIAEVIECCRAFLLCRLTHLELRDELTQILIALARFAEQRQPRRFRDSWCGSHAGGVSRGPKLETAISAPIWARMPFLFALV